MLGIELGLIACKASTLTFMYLALSGHSLNIYLLPRLSPEYSLQLQLQMHTLCMWVALQCVLHECCPECVRMIFKPVPFCSLIPEWGGSKPGPGCWAHAREYSLWASALEVWCSTLPSLFSLLCSNIRGPHLTLLLFQWFSG